MKYKLIKLSDDVFNGKHPNGIIEGLEYEGQFQNKPQIGKRFHFGTDADHPREHLFTSTVTHIINKEVFKTKNSTYKLEKIKKNE